MKPKLSVEAQLAEAAKQLAEKDRRIAELETECRILQSVVERLLPAVTAPQAPPSSSLNEAEYGMMRSMTPRQHAVAQMIVRGASNSDIARRFKLTENGAKSHVRYVMLKVGGTNRAHIASIYSAIMRRIPPNEYKSMAEIPIDWDATWTPSDPFTKRMAE